MTDPIRIPAHPAIGIHGWEMTITPDIQSQILAPAVGRIAALEQAQKVAALGAKADALDYELMQKMEKRIAGLESGENTMQNVVDEMGRRIAALEQQLKDHWKFIQNGIASGPADQTPAPVAAEPFLGEAHQSELERAHLLSVADQCEQDGDAHGAADAYDAADKPAMVRVPPPTLMVGNGGTNTDTKPAAQGDEAADTDTEARATIRGIIFKRFTVTTTDEMRVQISYDIFAAIRRGDVPGVYDESAVKQEQAASYAAGVRDGQAIGVAEIARLREKLDGSVNTKTHEHAVRYAEQMVADRDRLAAQVAELTRERESAIDRADTRDGEVERARTNYECASRDVEVLKDECRTLRKAYDTIGADRDRLAVQVAELERELETAKDGRAVHLKSSNEAVAERDKALSELAAVDAKGRGFAEKCDRLEAELAAYKEALSGAQDNAAQWKERAEKAEESQRHTQKAREDDRGRLQQKCSDWGTYWRAPDAHGVELSIEQAVELLQDALGVEVEIKDAARAEAEAAKQEAARMRARKVLPCLPQVGDYAPWGQVKDIVRRELKAAGVEVEG